MHWLLLLYETLLKTCSSTSKMAKNTGKDLFIQTRRYLELYNRWILFLIKLTIDGINFKYITKNKMAYFNIIV